jgi:hypothetical protein
MGGLKRIQSIVGSSAPACESSNPVARPDVREKFRESFADFKIHFDKL